MEIERKFLPKYLPEGIFDYPYHDISQGYLCTEPVVRIRQLDDQYILTYKSKGLMVREEHEFPLTKESYEHLLKKCDGNPISKRRHLIPDGEYTIEFDVFKDAFEGIYLIEVEFPNEEEALSYKLPDWFGEDVTNDGRYHNSQLSQMDLSKVKDLVVKL